MSKAVMATDRKAAAAYLAARSSHLIPEPVDNAGPMQWSDAWLLLAVETARQGQSAVNLADIIAAGDWLNHAIFTADELEDGFRRLQQAGLLEIGGAACRLTDAFKDAWMATGAEEQSLDRQLEAVRKLLGAPKWSASR